MKLLVTTGSSAVYLSGRAITIPANSVDYIVYDATVDDERLLLNEPGVTVLKAQLERTGGQHELDVVAVTAVVAPLPTINTAVVSLQLKTARGVNVAGSYKLVFGVFNDVNCEAASTNGTLATATKGTILSGSASAAVVVTTDANGEFACTLTDATDETVYLSCKNSGAKSLILDSAAVTSVTFA